MRLRVTARHVEIPSLFEELLQSKVDKLEKFGHKIVGLHAIFGREKYYYTAELTLSAKGMVLVGTARDRRDLLTCMEQAIMKLKEQLRRHESKLIEKRRRAARELVR